MSSIQSGHSRDLSLISNFLSSRRSASPSPQSLLAVGYATIGPFSKAFPCSGNLHVPAVVDKEIAFSVQRCLWWGERPLVSPSRSKPSQVSGVVGNAPRRGAACRSILGGRTFVERGRGRTGGQGPRHRVESQPAVRVVTLLEGP
jgi:hypothetical protein